MSNKDSIDMQILKRNGMVTFTTECKELGELLEDCKRQNIKAEARRFPSFVTVVLR